nr:MAG TPA: hypothetical protein [Caudoviricetes sp.]
MIFLASSTNTLGTRIGCTVPVKVSGVRGSPA